MPIALREDAEVFYTTLSGQLTDAELHAYYSQPRFRSVRHLWREVVDGRAMTDMAITSEGQRRLMVIASEVAHVLRGGRVAMVAATDEAYGMFRMWELRREGLGYEVSVFRDYAEALEWVVQDAVPVARAAE